MAKNNKSFGKNRNFSKKGNSNNKGKPTFKPNKPNGKIVEKKASFALQKSAGIGKKNTPSQLKSILKKKPVESDEENDSEVDEVEMDSDVSVSSYDAEGSSDIDPDDAAELKRLLKGIKGDGDDSEEEEDDDDEEEDDDSSVEEVKIKSTKAAEKSKPVVAVKESKKKETVNSKKAEKEKPVVVNGNKAKAVEPVKKTAEEPKQDKKQNAKKNVEVTKPIEDKVVEVNVRKYSFNQPDAIVKEQNQRLDEYNSRCVYIRPVPTTCTPGMIKELAPELVACRIPVGKKNQSKGFAFIEFKSAGLVEKYVKLLNGKLFAGKPVTAAIATNSLRPESIEGYDLKSLYVSGLSKEVKPNDLKLVFPLAVEILLGQSSDKSCLGSALIKYDSKDAALQGFEKHNKLVRGKEICVTFPAKNDAVKKTKSNEKPNAAITTVSAKKRKREEDEEEDEEEVEMENKNVSPNKKIAFTKKKPLKRVKSVK